MLARVVVALAFVLASFAPAMAEDPDALWKLVHNRCVLGQSQGDPSPCAFVGDGPVGYAVLKDLKGVAQFLLIPTTRITGIEDPAVLAPEGGELLAAAWSARRFLQARLQHTLARDQVSLAVNSVEARSQRQLHIHIDCTRPDVRQALEQHASEIGPEWAWLTFPLAGHHYAAMRVEGDDLTAANPFTLLFRHLRQPAEMATHDLVVIGTASGGRPGFILLERGDPNAHGTELQDLSCRDVLAEPEPPG